MEDWQIILIALVAGFIALFIILDVLWFCSRSKSHNQSIRSQMLEETSSLHSIRSELSVSDESCVHCEKRLQIIPDLTSENEEHPDFNLLDHNLYDYEYTIWTPNGSDGDDELNYSLRSSISSSVSSDSNELHQPRRCQAIPDLSDVVIRGDSSEPENKSESSLGSLRTRWDPSWKESTESGLDLFTRDTDLE